MTPRDRIEAVIEGWKREAEMYLAQARFLNGTDAETTRTAAQLMALCASELKAVLNEDKDGLAHHETCFLAMPHDRHPWTHPVTLKNWNCEGKTA